MLYLNFLAYCFSPFFPLLKAVLSPPLLVPKFSSLLHPFPVPSNHHLFSPGYRSTNITLFCLCGSQDPPALLHLLARTPLLLAQDETAVSHCRAAFLYCHWTGHGKTQCFSANTVNTDLNTFFSKSLQK